MEQKKKARTHLYRKVEKHASQPVGSLCQTLQNLLPSIIARQVEGSAQLLADRGPHKDSLNSQFTQFALQKTKKEESGHLVQVRERRLQTTAREKKGIKGLG